MRFAVKLLVVLVAVLVIGCGGGEGEKKSSTDTVSGDMKLVSLELPGMS